ncbi:MAG: xanthine dehydrogenase family protein subunit M [Pseudomonadota bacterium]|nr:xanthine dehydrogenase family protein subunit M [Pseudomonadota bacterium]
MKNFAYQRPTTLLDAARLLQAHPDWQVLAGGTTMIDLLKLDVASPAGLVDITAIDELQGHEVGARSLRFNALARMADVADDTALRAACPALTESLWKAASPQLRNAARLSGNILQRTRCPYFRDTAYPCNKRAPGSGCSALDGGRTHLHALFGGSTQCVAMYPGDWAQALIAFDAVVTVSSTGGTRRIAFADLHRLPGDRPDLETVLHPGEIVTTIEVPVVPAMKGSHYLKARDRQSYAFASVSAAVGIELDGETVKDARIALGGVAAKPWRATAAEAVLQGRPFSEALAREAGRVAFQDARPLPDSAYKIALGADVVTGALLTAHARARGTRNAAPHYGFTTPG